MSAELLYYLGTAVASFLLPAVLSRLGIKLPGPLLPLPGPGPQPGPTPGPAPELGRRLLLDLLARLLQLRAKGSHLTAEERYELEAVRTLLPPEEAK